MITKWTDKLKTFDRISLFKIPYKKNVEII